jgi:hypothetical protein
MPTNIADEVKQGIASLDNAPAISRFSDDFNRRVKGLAKNRTDGFLYGLYYRAWHEWWAALDRGVGGSPLDLESMAVERETLLRYMEISEDFRWKLRLTDEQVIEFGAKYYVEHEDQAVLDFRERRGLAAYRPRQLSREPDEIDDGPDGD